MEGDGRQGDGRRPMNARANAAVNRACAAILTAPIGAQETPLHHEAYSVGGLVGPDLSESEAFASQIVEPAL
jgi:hypothetical protein